MRLLVFQHIECEHPGMLRTFLREDNVTWDAVKLDAGDPTLVCVWVINCWPMRWVVPVDRKTRPRSAFWMWN